MQKLKDFYAKIPTQFKNKYAITIFIFLLWMIFFDRNDIISQVKLTKQLNDLEEKRVYYKDKLKEVEETQEELFTDERSVEKFAREKYWMKKSNEDMFIIVEE